MTTVKASPTISTIASETAGGVVGTSVLSDSATLTGGYNPTGTITFTLTHRTAPPPVDTGRAVSGDGTYTTPTVPATRGAAPTSGTPATAATANNNAASDARHERVGDDGQGQPDDQHDRQPDGRRRGGHVAC